MKAKSSARGMSEAVMMPPRILPRSSTSTKTTMSAPSMRLRAMVDVVRWMRSERSRNGLMVTPGGRVFCTCATRAFTSSMTLLLFEPLSIMMAPPTAS